MLLLGSVTSLPGEQVMNEYLIFFSIYNNMFHCIFWDTSKFTLIYPHPYQSNEVSFLSPSITGFGNGMNHILVPSIRGSIAYQQKATAGTHLYKFCLFQHKYPQIFNSNQIVSTPFFGICCNYRYLFVVLLWVDCKELVGTAV